MLDADIFDILENLLEAQCASETKNKVRPMSNYAIDRINKMENIKMTKGPSLQDPFLNTLRKEKVPVSIYLVNGIKLQGLIESFDQFVVLLKNTVSQMVYKHAISTVVPARNVLSPLEYDNGQAGRAITPPSLPLSE